MTIKGNNKSMKTDKFYLVSTTDKLSRMLMLVFTGIILGTVIARTCYDLLNPVIDIMLGVIALFSVFFTFYMFFTSIKKSSTNVAIFKDGLSFIISKRDELPTRTDIEFSDIKSLKISPQTTKKNLSLEEPDPDKFFLRAFGYRTVVELNNGEKYEFSDSKTDGVLMYSPAYIYRMLDVKKMLPSLNLELCYFNSKNDNEDFLHQFDYYAENGKCLPLCKNKKYIVSLLQYTALFFASAFIISSFVSVSLSMGLNNYDATGTVMLDMFKTFVAIIIPMWALAYTIAFYGSRRNEEAQKVIYTLLK